MEINELQSGAGFGEIALQVFIILLIRFIFVDSWGPDCYYLCEDRVSSGVSRERRLLKYHARRIKEESFGNESKLSAELRVFSQLVYEGVENSQFFV